MKKPKSNIFDSEISHLEQELAKFELTSSNQERLKINVGNESEDDKQVPNGPNPSLLLSNINASASARLRYDYSNKSAKDSDTKSGNNTAYDREVAMSPEDARRASEPQISQHQRHSSPHESSSGNFGKYDSPSDAVQKPSPSLGAFPRPRSAANNYPQRLPYQPNALDSSLYQEQNYQQVQQQNSYHTQNSLQFQQQFQPQFQPRYQQNMQYSHYQQQQYNQHQQQNLQQNQYQQQNIQQNQYQQQNIQQNQYQQQPSIQTEQGQRLPGSARTPLSATSSVKSATPGMISYRMPAVTGSDVGSSTTSASVVIPHENLEAYRQEIKKTKDPIKQYDFAKQLILVADEMRKNPQGLEAQKVRKNRDILHNEALKWLKKAATATYNGKTGYPESLFYLADCYGNGNLGLTIDHERAFGYYSQGCKHDHPSCIYRTGVCYEVGAGPKRDYNRAVQYYRKAALLGDTAAMFKMGMILLEGSLGQGKRPKEGVNLLKRAAAQADEATPYALHELAILYEGSAFDPSTGIVPDPSYAFELYLKSAKLGYAPSQYKLGLAHEYGHLGLAIDAKRSIAWYTKAAQQGESEAELALSGWYLTGFETLLVQSNKEAYLWARKAADKGLAKAEYAVGYFLEHGIGVDQNLEEARRWYLRAAGQGNTRAIARLSDKGGKKEAVPKTANWRQQKDAQNGQCSLM